MMNIVSWMQNDEYLSVVFHVRNIILTAIVLKVMRRYLSVQGHWICRDLLLHPVPRILRR